jgi:IS30 family transposase
MAKKTKKASKKKTRKHLTAKEIATVKRMTKSGATMRKIAAKIRRAPSTIWRWQNR